MLAFAVDSPFSLAMHTTLAARGSAGRRGVRSINLRQDTRQILNLLDIAFGSELDQDNRRILHRSLLLASQPWYQPALTPLSGPALGFVWEEANIVVGNVSILRTNENGRYIIANVAVDPEWRRQGIARQLMEASLQHLQEHHAHTILLQVKEHNQAAQKLYQQLGFISQGSLTSWQHNATPLKELPLYHHGSEIRPLRGREWWAAYQLDLAAMPSDLNWPDPLPTNTYKNGLWIWFNNFMNARQTEHWAMTNSQEQLIGIASIYSEWSRAHNLALRVHPDSRGQIERPLFAKLLRRLAYLPRRQVRMDHPADDTLTSQLLREVGFQPQRTLTVMRLDLPHA